jgi:3-dehydroquinate synthase
MKVLEVHGRTGDSTIWIGENLRSVEGHIPGVKRVIITDTNVRRHYGKSFPVGEVIEIGTGEKIKNLDTVKEIYERLMDLEVDRSSFIVGIGGGIVCDITGFVASTFLRGLRFGFVSTTLLSQVDASVGGKNGVNLDGYKNMVGVFNQPEFVICDMHLLKTLPEREVSSGFAEIVKHAVIGDTDLFSYLEEHFERALDLDPAVIEKLVYDSITIKSSIVNRDEREEGERRKLNFGHTFGHAIEKATGVSHGEAVSAGMVVASRLSERRASLHAEDVTRIETLVKKLRLPIRLRIDREGVLDAMRKDKKRKGDSVDFVLLERIGKAFVKGVPFKELETTIREVKNES